MLISYSTPEQVQALVEFSKAYFSVNNNDYFILGIPDWYAEVILVLFHPQLMFPKHKIAEIIRNESRDTVRAIVFLDITSYSHKLETVRQLGFNNFVGIMLTLWAEVNKAGFFSICNDCPVQLRCLYPRIAMTSGNDPVVKDASPRDLISSCLRESQINPLICELLRHCNDTQSNVGSTLSEFGTETFEILVESLSPQSDDEDSQGDESPAFGYSSKAKPATYTLNMHSVPKFDDLSFLMPIVKLRKKSREILKNSGVRTSFFDRREESDLSITGFAEPVTVMERLHDTQLVMLPKDLYYRALLESDEGMVPVIRGKQKTRIQMTVYVDFSASMIPQKEGNSLETAIATACALMDCFGPYGGVRVVPFSEVCIPEYSQAIWEEKGGSDKWLAKLCVNNGQDENILNGFAGTDIAYAMGEDLSCNAREIRRKDCVCYIVLITDAEDVVGPALKGTIASHLEKGVSINTVHITNDYQKQNPLVNVLQKHTTFQQVYHSTFESYAPELIQTIAKSYRSQLR